MKYGAPGSKEIAGPSVALDNDRVLVFTTAVDRNVAVIRSVLNAGVLIRRIPLSDMLFVTVREDVTTDPLTIAAAVLSRGVVILAFGITKELIWFASRALEMTRAETDNASKLIPDAPPNTNDSANTLSEYRLFMFAFGKCMESVAYRSFKENRVEKRDVWVEMDWTVDVPLNPYRLVYWAVFAKIEEVDREPPVFRILALEMEMAGANMVDNIRRVVVDTS